MYIAGFLQMSFTECHGASLKKVNSEIQFLFLIFPLLSLHMKINAEATFLTLGRYSLLLDVQVENVKMISRVKQVLANHLFRRGKGRQSSFLAAAAFSLLLGSYWEP